MRSTRAIPAALVALAIASSSAGVMAQMPNEAADLRRQIADLKNVIAALEAKIDALERTQTTASQPSPPALQPAPPPTSGEHAMSGLAERETSRRDAETAARVNNVSIEPSRKGYIDIPGTDSSFKIGGYAKLDAIVDPDPAGNPDQFTASSIPVGVPEGAKVANFNLQARQTRLNVDFRRPTRAGDLRVFVEADFFGGDGATAFRLRHAYGQAKNVLLGWTWSTLVSREKTAVLPGGSAARR